MCVNNVITSQSSPEARHKIKPVYHILPVSLGRDPAGNMDENNCDGGLEYVSAIGTEGSSRGSEGYAF